MTNEAKLALKSGKTYDIKIEYMDLAFSAVCKLNWRRAAEEQFASRTLWIPPGTWIDAWSGQTQTGPKSIEMKGAARAHPDVYQSRHDRPTGAGDAIHRREALGSDHAGRLSRRGMTAQATLYEDDGISNAYQGGAFRRTAIAVTGDAAMKALHVVIDPAAGTFDGAVAVRTWKVRLHLPTGAHAEQVRPGWTIGARHGDRPGRLCDAVRHRRRRRRRDRARYFDPTRAGCRQA